MAAWKLAPALVTRIPRPSEFTPLSALYLCKLISEIRNTDHPPQLSSADGRFGRPASRPTWSTSSTASTARSSIEKVAFTGSTFICRTIMQAAASSNLKKVTLKPGGKLPNIIFDCADLAQAMRRASSSTTTSRLAHLHPRAIFDVFLA